jgi:hypothetical protein
MKIETTIELVDAPPDGDNSQHNQMIAQQLAELLLRVLSTAPLERIGAVSLVITRDGVTRTLL